MSHSSESEADVPSTSPCKAVNLLEKGRRRSTDSPLGGRFILGLAPRGLSRVLGWRLRDCVLIGGDERWFFLGGLEGLDGLRPSAPELVVA